MKLLRQDILSQQYGFNTCRHSLQGGMLTAQQCNEIIHLMYACSTPIQVKVSQCHNAQLSCNASATKLEECLGVLALIYTKL